MFILEFAASHVLTHYRDQTAMEPRYLFTGSPYIDTYAFLYCNWPLFNGEIMQSLQWLWK